MEIWKDIILNNKNYSVSNYWNFKSLNYKRTWKEKILKLYDNWKWYKYISIWKKYYIHRLVAIYFLDNIENKKEINHKDWNKSNNHIDNLEWTSKSENEKHKYKVLWYNGVRWMLWKIWELCKISKKINQYDLNNNFIKQWDSWMTIQRELWFYRWNIATACRMWWKKSYWFIWKYI